MSVSEATGFGAAWADPARTAAVLRARATSAGIPTAGVGSVPVADLAAAVVAAHVWTVALGVPSLSCAAQFPLPERAGAAAVLARAAGLAEPPATVDELAQRCAQDGRGPAPEPVLVAAAQAVRWLGSVCEVPVCLDAVAAAAEDLLGCGSPTLAAAAAALLLEAEQLSD